MELSCFTPSLAPMSFSAVKIGVIAVVERCAKSRWIDRPSLICVFQAGVFDRCDPAARRQEIHIFHVFAYTGLMVTDGDQIECSLSYDVNKEFNA